MKFKLKPPTTKTGLYVRIFIATIIFYVANPFYRLYKCVDIKTYFKIEYKNYRDDNKDYWKAIDKWKLNFNKENNLSS